MDLPNTKGWPAKKKTSDASSVVSCGDQCPEACSDDIGQVPRDQLPGLLVKDTLIVMTPSGECEIELCLGDITRLEPKDKVDVILISAFGGSYSKGIGVMGSLFKNLKMDVAELARSHKEEDLQALYSCWWTKPLQGDNLPYGRLLCFETRGHNTFTGQMYYDPNRGARGRPQELVSHAFRCLVPILNNQPGSVITPLLNAGSQGCDECEMLQGMVENAVNWMKAGLPLRLLKIVIYAKVLSMTKASIMLQRADASQILTVFSQLKDRLQTKMPIPKEVKLDYDVYLSYSSKDQAMVDLICTSLRTLKPDIRLYMSHQKLDEDAIWQNEIYDVMTKCARVITVLSPNYLESADCLEQYNIALCCNRQSYRHILAPLFIETVTLPTYMGLVQYADCRKDPEAKISSTCQQLIKNLPAPLPDATPTPTGPPTTTTTPVPSSAPTPGPADQADKPFSYDVFVSYSHCDSQAANHIVAILKKLDPTLRIFYDIQELKTGHAWQQTLYHSIDGSRSMLAVMSKNYLKSSVCREEYSLAHTKHRAQDQLKLIPLRIEDLEQEASSFSEVTIVTATPDVFDATVDGVCQSLVSWLRGEQCEGEGPDQLAQLLSQAEVSDRLNVEELMEDHRKKMFKLQHRRMIDFPPKCFVSAQELENATYHDVKGEVILSFHPHDEKFAEAFRLFLQWAAPQLTVLPDAPSNQERLEQLDQARHIVAFLSPNYIESPRHVEEFHIALWRQRVSPLEAPLLLPIKVMKLARRPSYFHLVGSVVDLWDAMWASMEVNTPQTRVHGREEVRVSWGATLALMEAARVTLEGVSTARTLPVEDPPKVHPALLNPVHVQAEIKKMTKAQHKPWGPPI